MRIAIESERIRKKSKINDGNGTTIIKTMERTPITIKRSFDSPRFCGSLVSIFNKFKIAPN